MQQRARKFVGTFATLGFLIIYCLVAMVIGGQLVVGRGMALELVYYIIAGCLWLPIVMLIIKWMARPDEPQA